MEFFDIVGGFGRWQLRIFLFLLYVNIVGMWQNFSIVFQTPNMKFRCIQPSSEQLYSNSSAVVFDNRCEVPQEENSSILVPCTEWEYDTSSTSDTIVSEWDLVCSRNGSSLSSSRCTWLDFYSQSSYSVVFQPSSFAIASRASACSCLSCPILSVCSSPLRFFQAFGRAGITTTGYVLIREIVGSEHQTVMGLAIQVGWSIGFVTLVGVAWFFRNWFWLQLVIALSFIPIVFAFGIISESPRWLLTRGKTKKLERLLTKAAAINGRKVKDEEIEGFKLLNNKHENEKQSATLLEVLRMPRMRKRLLIMIYVWFVNVSLYYAFSYNISDLAGNMYLNFFTPGPRRFSPVTLNGLFGV
ncbi:solute carrier family 22 member 3 [Trichonephila inaurata madagascariensis]|uniref:Solute carrier family 22 member 3 n=1 Tax=Trichonephila inaurata madagascariensis TaxID=2747483 RepID=A0A8X6IID0_9ARAC|nr:solute carrier family 22 member 3 [Trichonephila inaurata madagascariensis]